MWYIARLLQILLSMLGVIDSQNSDLGAVGPLQPL